MAGVGMVTKSLIQKVGGPGALIGDTMNIVGAKMDYNYAREQGNSKAMSAAKAVGTFFFYESMGLWAIPFSLVTGGIQMAGAVNRSTTQQMAKGYGMRGKLGSGHFEMTEAGYTMRQRSLNAIRNNGINTQSALGNEARTYYRGAGY